MNVAQQLVRIVLTLAIAAAVGAGAWWLFTNKPSGAKTDKPAAAATITKVVKEDDLNTITLTEEAEKRLGLTIATVEKKATRRVRMYGGEVTIPVGRAILVAAPLGGILKAPAGGMPKAGDSVKAGQNVFQLLPLLTPDGRASLSASLADADGIVNNAKTQVEIAKIALERSKRVLKEGAGSQRLVDEAQAAFDIGTKSLEAAIARRTVLAKVLGDVDSGTAAPIPIDSPEDGILRTVSAMPGLNVPSGAALFEVVDLSTMWVRVPLPVGDLDAIDRSEPAQIGKLSASPGTTLTPAKPVIAPPSANPISATVDVFYEMSNANATLTPGQRLGVTIPLSDAKESATVPWSAVVFDVHGGNWIYEQLDSHRYARRRVVVQYTVGADAVLASGPAVGTKIVTAGTQELFGAETGFVK